MTRESTTVLGFDLDAGPLDPIAHPFNVSDSDGRRVASRYTGNNALGGIMAIVHETDDPRCDTGLSKNWRYKPVGASMGMGVAQDPCPSVGRVS